MKILKRAGMPGMPTVTRYLVEAEPERRLVFFRDSSYIRQIGEPLDIPIPRSLYVVNGPTFKDGKPVSKTGKYPGASTHQYAIENDGKKVTDKTPIYLLPWPNYYNNGGFSLCAHDNVEIPEGATVEEIVEDTIIKSWNITFGYLMYPTPAVKWITSLNTITTGIKKHYVKWEKLTLEKACAMPWGRFSPNLNGKHYWENNPATNQATVQDLKTSILGIK